MIQFMSQCNCYTHWQSREYANPNHHDHGGRKEKMNVPRSSSHHPRHSESQILRFDIIDSRMFPLVTAILTGSEFKNVATPRTTKMGREAE
jgi:hypothetical protein